MTTKMALDTDGTLRGSQTQSQSLLDKKYVDAVMAPSSVVKVDVYPTSCKRAVSSLRKLDEHANKFYDRKLDLYEAALLTRYYTQHVLRPYIDSEINHVRHFIKIPFINKGLSDES